MNLVYLRQSKTRKRLVLMQLKHRQEIKLDPQRKRWLHLRASYLIGSSFLESHRERANNLMIYTCDVRKKFRRVEAPLQFLSWILIGFRKENRNSTERKKIVEQSAGRHR